MKIRLKNQQYQQELDKALHGKLSEALESLEKINFSICGGVIVKAGPLKFFFSDDEFELIPEQYDPNAWNNYPEVTPPEGVPMRVECDGDRKLRTCLVFKNGQWHYESGVRFGNREDGAYYDHERGLIVVKRFRPWD